MAREESSVWSHSASVQVVYCSEECQQSNYLTNHRYECGLLDVIDNQEIGRMATLAYR